MSLLPKIEIVFDNVSKTIKAYDSTGFYDATTNPGGYGGPNVARSALTSASMVIHQNKKYFFSMDVLDVIRTSLDEVVDLGEINATMDEDGVYKVFLIVNLYPSFGKLLFVYENIKKLMSVYWAKLACIYDIYKKKELETECIWLESNIQGLEALDKRSMESEYINLLRFIEKRFEVNEYLTK